MCKLGSPISRLLLAVLAVALSFSVPAAAKDLRITVPKRSKATPVQKLNRDGVKAIQDRDYNKAKKLFYKAYLLDPNDPFTLNNLGYVAELEGDVDRAQRFYDLAVEQNSDALVAHADADGVIGKNVTQVASGTDEQNMQINRLNVQALGLLMKDRAPEADVTLTKALQMAPNNPFTLNNMGFAKEKEGELEAALSYYGKAAALRSQEPIVVTINKDWRGKPISEVASDNAEKIRRLIRRERDEDMSTQVARLNLRGVSALNRNDKRAARQYFEQAYKLDPRDAFTLNNMGYVAEIDGDRETAQFFYDRAQMARGSEVPVGVATRRDVEGRPMSVVADSSEQKVQQRMTAEAEKRRTQGPPKLIRRSGPPPADSTRPALPELQTRPQENQQPPQQQQPQEQQPPR
jgi:Flp pilus assembly protein TadD